MDPYEVLGVSRDADDETIKKAYRTLVKKYHPDKYVNTPMADTASEKMKQINEAYDIITNKNTTKYSGGYASDYDYDSDNYNYQHPSFEAVRMLISARRFSQAEAMLDKLPQTAEWFYLMGIILFNRGWYNRGMEYINKALSLDPTNTEYQATAYSFRNSNKNYRNVVFTANGGIIPCSTCSSLCASWLLFRFCCGCC